MVAESLSGLNVDLALLGKVARAIVIVIIGYFIAKIASSITEKVVKRNVNPHLSRVSKKAVFYLIVSVAIITAIDIFIEVTTILAAAGIAGIAIGMAAQKSVSNIISGLFLLADQPFEIGDAVDIGGDAGVVLDISLFSTRLRTFDNKYLRIPNEVVAGARIINLTYYDIRRLDLPVGVAYKEDVGRAVEVITKVVKNHPKVLVEPEPQILVSGFGDSSINIEVRAWVQRVELFIARTDLVRDIKAALDAEGIEIPFPHRTLYFGTGEMERLKSGR